MFFKIKFNHDNHYHYPHYYVEIDFKKVAKV